MKMIKTKFKLHCLIICIVHDQHNINDLYAPGLFYYSATFVSAFYLEPIVIFPKMTKLHSFHENAYIVYSLV